MQEFLYWLKGLGQTALGAVIMAVALLVVALIVAALAKKLVVKLISKEKIKNALNKHSSADDIIGFIGTLIYLLVFMLFVPSIFNALGASTVSSVTTDIMNKIWSFLPNVLVAALILFIGCTVAKLIKNLIDHALDAAGIDTKFAELLGEKGKNFKLSNTIATVIYIVLLIFIVVESLNVLNLAVLSNIGAAVIGYLPATISAILIMAVAFFASMMLEKVMSKGIAKAYTLPVKIVIMTVGAFMALNQLGIATEMVNAAFILVVAAICIAGAIAFGIGGREFAAKQLSRLDDKITETIDSKPTAPADSTEEQ